MAGVMVVGVLWPRAIMRVPTSTPMVGFQLYSRAGAKPTASLEPVFSWLLGGDCAGSFPVMWVLFLWRYIASRARTQWRVRLYSQAASTRAEAPGLAWPWNPVGVL